MRKPANILSTVKNINLEDKISHKVHADYTCEDSIKINVVLSLIFHQGSTN